MNVAELVVTDTSQARGPAGRVIEKICQFFAICSGLVLTALAAVLAQPQRFVGLRVGLVLSGGNVDIDALPWSAA